jgi:hypothetical protein
MSNNNSAAIKFYGTIEHTTTRGVSIATLTDGRGGWFGSIRIEASSKAVAYELGYKELCVKAHVHGGDLERYSVSA